MNKRFPTRELVLMMMPVLVLAGVALWPQKWRPQSLANRSYGPFRLTLVKTVREIPTPYEVSQGYDTKISVTLGHQGTRPAWWGKQDSIAGVAGLNQLVWKRSGKRAVLVPLIWEPQFVSQTDSYVARYLLTLAPLSSGDELRLRDRIVPRASSGVASPWLCPPVSFDAMARKKGEKTGAPPVSHDAGMKLIGWTLDTAPPAEHIGDTGTLRLTSRFRSNGPMESSWGVGGSLRVVDDRGRTVSISASNSSFSNRISLGDDGARFKRRIGEQIFEFVLKDLTKTRGPLFARGLVHTGENWPLQVNIPLRDANQKLLLTRRMARSFRVLSIVKRAATRDEKVSSKVDTVVCVQVVKLKPGGKSMLAWNWQDNFSSHLRIDSNRTIWKLPGGANAVTLVGSSFSDNEVIFRYGINMSKVPPHLQKVWFANAIGVVGGERVPVRLQLR